MIKKLLVIGALLAPGLAYSQANNTLPYPQVNPAGVPPAPPAQAQAAGFTTCVLCMDFTVPTGGVWINGAAVAGVNAAQPSTWLDCAGAASPLAWHYARYLGGNKGTVASGMPCPDITGDGAGNSQVLHIVMPPTTVDNANGFELWDNNAGQSVMIPTNSYFEVTYWIQSFPAGAYSTGPFTGGEGEIPAAQHNHLEFDAFEIDTNTVGGQSSCEHVWLSGLAGMACNWYATNPPHFSGYDPTSGYHAIGMRITSDGSTTLYKCMWIDNVFQSCVTGTVSGSPGNFTAAQLSDASSRMETLFHPAGGPLRGRTTTTDMVTYTKSLRVWACTNWRTTACSTPGNADPGGY